MTVAAYFQCYKSPLATFHTLLSFRKQYPVSTIILVSDNGYNFTKMAEHFNCIYIHSENNYPYVNEYFTPYKSNVPRLMERILHACSLIKEEYIMWLEDDVYIHNKTVLPLNYDLNGFCPNTIRADHFINIRNDFSILNTKSELRFTGHGGSIYKKGPLIEILKDKSTIHILLENWTKYFGLEGNICQDLFISILFHIHGFTLGPLEGHGDSDVFNNSLDIQHQYKVYYNQTGESIGHLFTV